MNRYWKLFNYLISAILSLAGILIMYCVWSRSFMATNTIFPDSGVEVPMRVVGINMPAVLAIGVCLVIASLVIFLSAKRKKISTGLIWVNAIAILIIVCGIIVLMT